MREVLPDRGELRRATLLLIQELRDRQWFSACALCGGVRPRPNAPFQRIKPLVDLRDEFLRDLLEDMWKSLLENLLERRALSGLDILAKSATWIFRGMGSEFLLEAAVRDHFVDDGLIRQGSERFEIVFFVLLWRCATERKGELQNISG